MADPARAPALPVEAWTNGRHGVLYIAAYGDQVSIVLPNNTVVELELGVFRQMMLRTLIAAYSAPPRRCPD